MRKIFNKNESKMRNVYILFALTIMIGLIGCIEKLKPEDVKSIQYSFHDASVPPPYHRSYDIIIEPNQAKITVDSYGDVLADTSFKIKGSDFEQLITTINEAQLQSGKAKAGAGCTGGTAEELKIIGNDQQIYEGRFEHCGGNKIPTRMGDYKKVVAAIKNLIPHLDELLK
jgi:hypothetical protein